MRSPSASKALDTELYKNCGRPGGTCPAAWPSTGTDSGKIDDMFHAAVNGRGKYVSAMSTTELNEALMDLRQDIETRMGSAAALATNSIQRRVGSVIYQGIYNTANWFGEVQALPLNVTTGAVGAPMWRASDHVPTWNLRTILSFDGSSGINFEAASLTAAQSSLLEASGLGSAADIVDFIRGDTANNLAHGGAFRIRTHPLGDVVHSSPVYHKSPGYANGVVYIGANDGMLHAFDAADGHELFAYVPNLVYGHLAELADPGYVHRFYVDSTPEVAKVTSSQHILVNGLGKGGKGYFALDVTNPAAMVPANVLWEYSAAGDDDLGFAYSRAYIVNTQAAGKVVVFSNGYDSVNGSAVLYVLNVQTGALIKKFDTGVTGCNGLATPAVVDIDMDGKVDYAFAGDLKGNMWKFDLRGASVADWQFSYQDGADPHALDYRSGIIPVRCSRSPPRRK
jgi:type IV pilus assembly protein PilY1